MNFVYKSKILSWCYCKATQLRYPSFKKEVERRSELNIFNYKEIAQPLPKCYYEICTDNNFFGIGYGIRKYIGYSKSFINALVEHGYFFGTYVQDVEKATFSNKILTFGDVRKKHITDVINNKEVIPIGPYIHYAPDYYDESRLKEEKKKLGKTLLVFFSHSGTGEKVSFDLEALIQKINSIRGEFNSVIVSLFWSDINPDIEKRLHDEGYLIFSSGHRYDYFFLSRQKTVIKLADYTMSNSVGTHLAYCSYLNKPHWLVKQKISVKAVDQKGVANVAISDKIDSDPIFHKEQDEIYEAFAEYTPELTNEQRRVCDKYFGFSYVRSEEEMKRIIEGA
jgi:hypothetical protein